MLIRMILDGGRMVYLVEMKHKPYRKVAENLAADSSTVCRIVNLFSETGNFDKRKHP